MGQSIHDPITTLVEINWWGTWCYRCLHNGSTCTEIRHHRDVIVGQLITATTIDHFGLIGMPIREVNITKLIGLIIVAFGLVFYFFGDKLVELFGAR